MVSHLLLIRVGMWTLPISGFLFVIGYSLNGALPDPARGAIETMSAFAAPRFELGAFVNLVGMLLNPFGFFALYAHIAAASPSRSNVFGLVMSVLGIGLTLTGYGVVLLDLPFLGQQYLLGHSQADEGFAVATNPTFVSVLVMACVMYFLGSFFYSVALWRAKLCPPIVSISLTLSAFFLGFGPLLPMPALWGGILGGLLLLGMGGWLAWHADNGAILAA